MWSIILGFILGYALVKTFYVQDRVHGPNSGEVRRSIFKGSKGCYKLQPVVHICPISYNKKH